MANKELNLKTEVVHTLEQIEAEYAKMLNWLHPSLNIYQELKDFKAAVHDLIGELEEGKYDKEPEIHWKGAVAFK
jgi:hypothetical protein